MKNYTISEVAAMCEMSRETLRYYESIGLIDAPERSAGGFRQYSEETIERLHFIKRAQDNGFTLKEIAELLLLSSQPQSSSSSVRNMVQKKLNEVDAKIEQSKKLRASLQMLLKKCNGTASVADCPIIEDMSADIKMNP